MADMNNFLLDGTRIDVEDATARSTANSASSTANAAAQAANQNAQDIADIKALGRVTVSYDNITKAIVINTTGTHTTPTNP